MPKPLPMFAEVSIKPSALQALREIGFLGEPTPPKIVGQTKDKNGVVTRVMVLMESGALLDFDPADVTAL